MEANGVTLIRYGNTNTFYIAGTKGGLLLDTDYAGTLQPFFRAIKEKGIEVKDITYLLATHYHPDHIGLAGELQELGVKLLGVDVQKKNVHFAERLFIRESRDYMPVNLNRAKIITCAESRKVLEKTYAYDEEKGLDLRRDWREIMSRRPKRIWYGHANANVL